MKSNIKYYLAFYNFTAFICWFIFLVDFFKSGFRLSSPGLLFLNIAQGLAALEIAHAALRWVKSPVGSTVAQVTSRLLVLVLINVFIKDKSMASEMSRGVFICSFAWGITELVRYSFYLLSLFDKNPSVLLWMRYTFFIVLYPLGVIGEWLVLGAPIFTYGLSQIPYAVFLVILLISYIYYFPVLYKYMWKQRNSKLK